MSEVEKYLADHRVFLKQYYDQGKFIVSGPCQPRNGGVILCKAENLAEINKIIQQDPFYIHDITHYEIIEFLPSTYAQGFEKFI